jgi:uncharacterized protein (DUF1501 family)
MLTRRAFLWRSGVAFAASTVVPPFLTRAAQAAQIGSGGRFGADTILVVIQMSGGNDGLNTVVPYGLDGYRSARPALRIPEADVLPLTDQIGLHPEMGALRDRYQAGQVAIIQGVGYPNQELSHFRAMDIWHTAAPNSYQSNGWLGNYLATADASRDNPMYAASITDGLSHALYRSSVTVSTIASLDAYQLRTDPRYPDDRPAQLACAGHIYEQDYRARPSQAHVARTALSALASSEEVRGAAQAYQSTIDYGTFPLARSLRTVAQLMAADLGTRVYYVAFGGFDTHSAQTTAHARLLGGFANAVDAFLRDVAAMGKGDRVLLMSFSEFGRRVAENASQGTDHGTAGPMFVVGQQVKGGLYGDYPSLTSPDNNRNLRYEVDFRAVYGTVLESWLGADQGLALGARYDDVGCL